MQGLTVHYCFFLIPNASIRYSIEPELFNVATSRAMNNTIIVLPTTIYKELIPEEVKNYLIKAKLGCETSTNPQQKVISSGNVQVKVIDKIDLSMFETPKQKSVKSSTRRNIYIIDTNVFVNCPDIISKIEDKYLVVLSAKVIDELDKLKIKLSSDEKRNVEAALRYINKAMDKSNVRMELSDLSLLPNDFDKRSPDNNILTVALKFKGENPINWSDVIKGFQTICSYFSFNSFMLSDTYRMTARGAECTGVFYNNGLRSVSEIQEVVTNIADLDPKGGAVIKELEMKVGDKNPQNAFEYIYCLTKSVLQENSKTEIAILSKFRETTRQLI